jgi:hypothetical protein
MKKREMVQRIAADTEITHIQADAAVEAILTAIKLVFRTLYRGFCLLRTAACPVSRVLQLCLASRQLTSARAPAGPDPRHGFGHAVAAADASDGGGPHRSRLVAA